MLKECLKLFIKSKKIIILYAILFLGSNFYMYHKFTNYIMVRQDDYTYYDCLEFSLKLAIFIFFVMTIISYEYFKKMKLHGICEINKMISEKRIFISQTVVLITCVFLLFLCILSWNLVAYKVYNVNNHIILNIILENNILYILLVNILAISIGYVMTLLPSEKIAVINILFIFMLVSPVMTLISDSISSISFNLYSIIRWFYILPQNITWSQNYYCPFSITGSDFAITLLWILVCNIFIICHFVKNSKFYFNIILFLFPVLAFCIYEGNYNTAGYVPGWDVKRSAAGHNYLYYEENVGKNQISDYYVKRYDLNLDIGHIMKAQVDLYLNKSTGNEYHFTLYHQYKLKKVLNADENILSFERNGDYIKVFSNGNMNKITFIYEGDAAGFYSSQKNIYLPGYFCYYPKPGYEKVYDSDLREFTLPSLTEAEYHLSINQDIYCNLEKRNSGEFSGIANGLEIVAGNLKSINYREVNIVYPYTGFQNIYNEDAVKMGIDEMLKMECDSTYSLKNKIIFLTPQINSARQYTFGSNWVELNTLESGQTGSCAYYKYFLEHQKNLVNNYFIDWGE